MPVIIGEMFYQTGNGQLCKRDIMQTQKGLSFPALVGFGCLITGFWAGYKVYCPH